MKPATLITNDFDITLKQLIRKYSRRWLVDYLNFIGNFDLPEWERTQTEAPNLRFNRKSMKPIPKRYQAQPPLSHHRQGGFVLLKCVYLSRIANLTELPMA